ncbi:MAG: dihydropteroate synthase [Candidatus Cloacimonetes bacterium]|nr:dihydropteroate synthase [Candidatus Cloacimonadota bacterium]
MHRILRISGIEQAERELASIGVSSQGIKKMALKAVPLMIKLTGVRVGAANILKQEMLSVGADAAVARGVVEGRELISDVILLGSADKISKLVQKLDHQQIFGLGGIRDELKRFLKQVCHEREIIFECGTLKINRNQILLMGILNVTPDSFSDGNEFNSVEAAIKHGIQMIDSGADIIDIGGESTRPGADRVSSEIELERVIPVIRGLRKETELPISIDTCKASVAEAALEAGVDLVNDVSALRYDPRMVELLRQKSDVPVILMHMLGEPGTMQDQPFYHDAVVEILEFFRERIEFCRVNGIARERLIIDPGIGFGKRHYDNLMILNKIGEFTSLGLPVLLGASRKSFLGRIYKSDPKERLSGSLAVAGLAVSQQVSILRVHNVLEHKRYLQTESAIRNFHEFSHT